MKIFIKRKKLVSKKPLKLGCLCGLENYVFSDNNEVFIGRLEYQVGKYSYLSFSHHAHKYQKLSKIATHRLVRFYVAVYLIVIFCDTKKQFRIY